MLALLDFFCITVYYQRCAIKELNDWGPYTNQNIICSHIILPVPTNAKKTAIGIAIFISIG